MKQISQNSFETNTLRRRALVLFRSIKYSCHNQCICSIFFAIKLNSEIFFEKVYVTVELCGGDMLSPIEEAVAFILWLLRLRGTILLVSLE
jgi:hypothetical protein